MGLEATPIVPAAKPEAKPAEKQPEVKTEPVKPADPPELAAKFAALAGKEAANVRAQQALKAERDALASDRAEYEKFKALKAKALTDPDSYLKAAGFDDKWYDKLTEYRLNAGKVTPELVNDSVSARLDAFERKQAEAEKARAEKSQADALQTFRNDAVSFVKAAGDEYELINVNDAQTLVPGEIESHYARTGKMLSVKEAAEIVEKKLEEQIAKNLETKKWKARGKPAETAKPGTTTTALNNGHTASAAAAAPISRSFEERWERAHAIADEYAARAKAKGA